MTFGFHVTALIDVLGQRDALHHVESRPGVAIRRSDLEEGLRGSVGRVLALRAQLEALVRSYARDPSGLPLTLRFFSDSCFLSAPLSANGNLIVAMERLLAVMGGCAACLATSLAGGIAVRGGLTVGTALELPSGELYGPVLGDVYALERSASYPRIVIGERLLEMVSSASEAPETRPLADLARSLVFADFDARNALDFIGPGAKRLFDTGAARVDLDGIRDFIERQRERFERERNGKLAERYRRLGDYVADRRGIWEDPGA